MIYMTNDEWKLISNLITSNEWFVLRDRLCVNTYDLDISEQALDNIMKDYKSKSKSEKRLWKARSFCIYNRLPIPSTTSYTDMRELTVDEAVSWYKAWAKHLNDYHSDAFTVYSSGLFYKKDGEWIRYMIDEGDKE